MRKLMWVAIGFAVASAIGMYLLHGSWILAASGLSSLLLAVTILLLNRLPKLRVISICLFCCVIGFGWLFIFEETYLNIPRATDDQRYVLTLIVTDYSKESDYGCVVSGIGRLNNKAYRMQIYLPKQADLSPGDTITARYQLRSTLPGGSAESSYFTSKGIFFTAKAFRTPDIVTADSLPWYGYPALVRESIKNTLRTVFPSDTAGFATALFIGDTDCIDYATDIAFKKSGISHIIAVSGFHVSVLFAVVYVLLGKKRLLAAVLGIPILIFFAAVAGFSASIMRACIMHSLMILALLFDKEYDPPTALGFAALIMLLLNPWMITNVGFQLSVGCMGGILLFSEKIAEYIMDQAIFSNLKGKRKKLLLGFALSIGMTVGATIVVTPLCAYYFGMVSLVGVLTNLLTTWIITLIFYGVMLVYIIALLWTPFGCVLGWIVAWPIRYVLITAKCIESLPLSAVYTDSVYIVLWLICLYIMFAVCCLWKRKSFLPAGCFAVITLCIALAASWILPKRDECRVTVLDVGQGQCILLQSEGKTYMVDCGGDSDTQSANIAAQALLSQGVYTLDGLIFTHFDRDHAAGATYLLQQIPTEMLYLPNCVDADGTLEPILQVHSGAHLTVSEMITVTYEGVKITLITSLRNISDNESGLCVLFQTKSCDILITGDRDIWGERELMRQIDLPELEVLIVGHHGSKYSTGEALLAQTKPEYAIISVGADNVYGHPTEETINRLLDAGCILYRTDIHGTILFRR